MPPRIMPSLDPNNFWEKNPNYVVKELGCGESKCDAFKIHIPFPGLHMKETTQVINAMTPIGVHPDILLDDKLWDTPVIAFMKATYAFSVGATHVTALASGGKRMLEQVVKAAKDFSKHGPKRNIVAVLVPSGMDDSEIQTTFGCSREDAMRRLAPVAVEAGIVDIVCSVPEIRAVREAVKNTEVKIWAVGIRPSWHSEKGTQISVGTPKEAADAKADVIITGSALLSMPSDEATRKTHYYQDRVVRMRAEMSL